jgi:O-methyltransferase involved in polyketide biosynthesis
VEGRNRYREVITHGETFKLGFDKEELESFFGTRGFDMVENINAPDLKPRYFHGATARRPVTPVSWFAHAATASPTGG